MAESIMRAGIDKLKEKYIPVTPSPTVFVQQEQYRSILPILDIWGYEDNDKDIEDKSKFIYDEVVKINKEKPDDALREVLVQLGATKWNEAKLERVYRWFRLKHEADKAKDYHGLLEKEMEELKGK